MTASYKSTQEPHELDMQPVQEKLAQEAGQFSQPSPEPLPSVPRNTYRGVLQEPQIEDNNIILHRAPNFIVRTAYQSGQKIQAVRRYASRARLFPHIKSQHEVRVSSHTTRRLPKLNPTNSVQKKTIPVPPWVEGSVVACVLLVTLLFHALTVFTFPHYELDEGTYMASAWAVLQHHLAPYPYGYGHPPLGWMQIALWVQVIGGFFAFGNAINTGRVLMILYALGSALLVYLIIRRLDGSRAAALLGMVFFSLSPLSIIFQHQVFLDNIGTFWLLLSLYFLVHSNSRLLYIVLAALCSGIAILSKEIFVLFIPAMLYALWLYTTPFQRKFAFVAFVYTVISLSSSFVLMAVLKGELFPAGWLPWDHHPHLSMLDTFVQQAQRSQNEGSFSASWVVWTGIDAILIAFSIVATVINLITGWWNRRHLLLSLLAISFWILLIRGGVVFPFYLIPMIPLAAFNAAVAINTLGRWSSKLARTDIVRIGLLFCVLVAITGYDVHQISGYLDQHPTFAQTQAMSWIRSHVPANSVIVINSYLYTDLHVEGGSSVGDGSIYPYAHIYWNIAYDPELHDGLLQNNWDRIDYIVADPSMLADIHNRGGPMLIINDALQHAALRAEFQSPDRDQHVDIQIYQVIHKHIPSVYRPVQSGNLATTSYNQDRKQQGHRQIWYL